MYNKEDRMLSNNRFIDIMKQLKKLDRAGEYQNDITKLSAQLY